MSHLFISCGGTSQYTAQLSQFMHTQNLYSKDYFIYLTFYELSHPLPSCYYYLPSKSAAGLSPKDWNTLLYNQLTELMKKFSINTIIYEGNFVYAGIIQSMKNQPSSTYIWLKPPSHVLSVDKREKYFDKVIILSPSFEELNDLFNHLKAADS